MELKPIRSAACFVLGVMHPLSQRELSIIPACRFPLEDNTVNLIHPNFDDVPEIKHPYADYSLTDALHLASGHQSLCLKPAPTTLEEAREVVKEMEVRCGFNWITGKTALDVLDAAIDGRDLTQSSRMILRESMDHKEIKKLITDRLTSMGWVPVCDFDMQNTMSVATRTFETYVGPKVAIAYLQPYENGWNLTGQYDSVGRNILSTTNVVIPPGLVLSDVKAAAERFAVAVDAVVADSYAMRLARPNVKDDQK
jgi:hypothetical protein